MASARCVFISAHHFTPNASASPTLKHCIPIHFIFLASNLFGIPVPTRLLHISGRVFLKSIGSFFQILLYIYIYCIYILHLCAFNIENAPRPNLRARSEPTAPPRPSSPLPHAPDRTFSFSRPSFSANDSTSSHKLQSHQTSSCNYSRQQLQSLFCLTDFWT